MTLPVDDLQIPLPADAATITDLTTNAIDGTGVFDQMMRTMTLHLDAQYEAGRITGKEYATVYLGIMTGAMEQSIAFLVQKQNVAKINADIGLVRQQIVSELANTDDTIPLQLGFNGDTSIEGMVALAKATETQKELLLTEQTAQVTAEIGLTEQKTITELAATDDAIPANLGFNPNAPSILGVIQAQKDKLAKDTLLVEQQTISELVNTCDTIPTGVGMNADQTAVQGLVKATKDKTEGEVELLSQKTATELAQTYDTIPAGISDPVPAGYTVTGTVKAQKDLYVKQTDGFDRDAEQKLMKMMLDTWTVRRTTDTAGTDANTTNKLDDISIGDVVTKAKVGIGAEDRPAKIYFDGGTSEFLVAETVTGQTSTESGVIAVVVLQAGSWGGNDAEGYIEFSGAPTGALLNNELLTSPSGSATANGTIFY